MIVGFFKAHILCLFLLFYLIIVELITVIEYNSVARGGIMSNILEINNLNYKYGKTTVFKDFCLSVEEGSYIGVAGSNASGKTTLIKLISGILPSCDSIMVGYSYVNSNRIHDHSRDFGVVFGQNLNCFLFDDVYKEMAFPLENLNLDVSEIEKTILDTASSFKISKLLDKKIIDLTNSEKQQLLIAIATLHKPKILLLDSAFTMMDRKTKKQIKEALINYKKRFNITIIETTSNLEDVVDCDYLYVIGNGGILIEGKPLVVFREDSLLTRIGLSLPFMVDLSLKLEFYELLDHIETDVYRMVDDLWK